MREGEERKDLAEEGSHPAREGNLVRRGWWEEGNRLVRRGWWEGDSRFEGWWGEDSHLVREEDTGKEEDSRLERGDNHPVEGWWVGDSLPGLEDNRLVGEDILHLVEGDNLVVGEDTRPAAEGDNLRSPDRLEEEDKTLYSDYL